MNKKALILVLVMLMPLGMAQSINITSFGGQDNTIEYIEDTNTEICTDLDLTNFKGFNLNITDNNGTSVYLEDNDRTQASKCYYKDLYNLQDGNLTATGKLTYDTDPTTTYYNSGGIDVQLNGADGLYNEFEVLEDTKINSIGFYLADSVNLDYRVYDVSKNPSYKSGTSKSGSWKDYDVNKTFKAGTTIAIEVNGFSGIPIGANEYSGSFPYSKGSFKHTKSKADGWGDVTQYDYLAATRINEGGSNTVKDSKNATKDTSLNYNLSKDLDFTWNFNDRRTVFYDDVISDAYTLDFTQSPESDYLNISEIRPNEIFGYINSTDDPVNYYNTKNETINVSNLSIGANREKGFDIRFSDIPQEFWDQMRNSSTNDLFTVNVITRSFDEENNFQASYQIDEQQAFDLPREGLVAVIRRAIEGFVYDVLDLLNPIFDAITNIFNWLIDALGFIINVVIDIFIVIASTILQVVSSIVGEALTIIGNALQFILFYHIDPAVEYNNETYDSFNDTDIGFLDTLSGNFSMKANRTMLDYFDGGIVGSEVEGTSLINHKTDIVLYDYSLRSIESQKSYSDEIPEGGTQ